jgi:hypothetical protein
MAAHNERVNSTTVQAIDDLLEEADQLSPCVSPEARAVVPSIFAVAPIVDDMDYLEEAESILL